MRDWENEAVRECCEWSVTCGVLEIDTHFAINRTINFMSYFGWMDYAESAVKFIEGVKAYAWYQVYDDRDFLDNWERTLYSPPVRKSLSTQKEFNFK